MFNQELDRAVSGMPELAEFGHQPSLMRAFEAAVGQPGDDVGTSTGGAVGRGGFRLLLHYVGYFTGLAEVFDAIHTDEVGDLTTWTAVLQQRGPNRLGLC